MCSTPPSSTVCLRVWPRGDVSLLISSDTTLLTPQSQTRGFSTRPCPDIGSWRGCSRSEQLRSRLGDQPSYTGVTRVIRLRQSLADSQTCHSFQTPTTKLQTVIPLKTQPVICTFISWPSIKYGLAEPETRWCNSPRSASCSLTFESEHDYWTVRPHHCFGDKNKNCE